MATFVLIINFFFIVSPQFNTDIIDVLLSKRMLLCIYEWTFQHFYFHGDILQPNFPYEVQLWDRNYFDFINEHFNLNYYQVLIAADDFEIPKLIALISTMISTNLETNSYSSKKKVFEEHNIYSNNLREKIFYQILQNRCIMSEFVHDQN